MEVAAYVQFLLAQCGYLKSIIQSTTHPHQETWWYALEFNIFVE